MSNYAGSSALSSRTRSSTRENLGGDCYVCGSASLVDVAHIISRASSADVEVSQPVLLVTFVRLTFNPIIALYDEELVSFSGHIQEKFSG